MTSNRGRSKPWPDQREICWIIFAEIYGFDVLFAINAETNEAIFLCAFADSVCFVNPSACEVAAINSAVQVTIDCGFSAIVLEGGDNQTIINSLLEYPKNHI
ncbi:hypothetical protein PanWU01x14_059050 [Parasponia andersonii]|uniref:Uncharacterized protein n=1 Tax=Parasponia andersonii TaxID=3476 RepID=A0A2P5DJB8_PARAD|nr:hypothetical protein PanWU01x14_059050 [Parasponia andersonii]